MALYYLDQYHYQLDYLVAFQILMLEASYFQDLESHLHYSDPVEQE